MNANKLIFSLDSMSDDFQLYWPRLSQRYIGTSLSTARSVQSERAVNHHVHFSDSLHQQTSG
jgi:hypothetical protein